MTLEDLEQLIADDEGGTVEYKETTGQRVEACRTLCAFMNGRGGTVVFGVTKKGKITGQLVSDETKRNLAEAFRDFEPGTNIPVERIKYFLTQLKQENRLRVEGHGRGALWFLGSSELNKNSGN